MANLTGMNLNPDVKEVTGDFEVVPGGRYVMVIVEDEVKDNAKKTGKVWYLKWQITRHSQYDGVPIKENLNLTNPSQISQEIGQGIAKRLCALANVPYPPAKTELLFGKPMFNTVKIDQFKSKTTGEMIPINKITAHNEVPADYTSQQIQIQRTEQSQENASKDYADEKTPW